MALVFSAIREKDIKVVCRADSALDLESMKKGDFDKYLKNLDEALLVFKEGETPTYFHMKTVATREEVLKQKDSMASMAMKAQQTGEMPLYTLMYETVKNGLKDITTDGVSQMVKGTNGLASDDIMTWLTATDTLTDLYTALEAQKGSVDGDLVKKK